MMANSTFIQLPSDVTNPFELRRFLDKLVQQLDVAFGNRGDSSFATEDAFISGVTTIQELIDAINLEALTYSKLDGSRNYTGIVGYDVDYSASFGNNSLVSKLYTLATFEPKFTKNTAFNKNFSGTGTATTVARSDHNHNTSYTNNPEQTAEANLNQTLTNRGATYSEAEADEVAGKVQELSDKVDNILAKLRSANIIGT